MARAVLFDLDDTLYNTTLQVRQARENAVKAMLAAGLDATEDEAFDALVKVVAEKGSNYTRHYDDMLKFLGVEPNSKLIAAGVVAYHEAKRAYLVPYPDTVATLLALRDRKYRIGVVTDGLPVKQWEKMIRLGLSDFFHTVIITDDTLEPKPSSQPFVKAAESLGLNPGDCVFVGDRLDKDIRGANKAGMESVLLVRGRHSSKKPSSEEDEPAWIVTRLADLLDILK
jgi:putative hydrolase of the HAD superfamily